QRVRAARAHLLHQRGEVRESARPAVGARRLLEFERGERVRMGGTGRDAVMLQERRTGEMRWLPASGAGADLDTGLPTVGGQGRRVAVGDVQQAYVAGRGQIVELPGHLARQQAAIV